MQNIAASQSQPEVPINENFETLSHVSLFGIRQPATTGLTWGFFGGRLGGTAIANGTVTLTNGTHYVVAARSDNAVTTSTATTNWNDTSAFMRLYKVVAASSQVSSYEDHRLGPGGVLATDPVPRRVNSRSADYTLLDADRATYIYHPSADTTARTWTIPANSSVAWPIGVELEFINDNLGGVITIAITTDTMRLAGAGTTGSRTLAANGWARAKKLTATTWIIRGEGLT